MFKTNRREGGNSIKRTHCEHKEEHGLMIANTRYLLLKVNTLVCPLVLGLAACGGSDPAFQINAGISTITSAPATGQEVRLAPTVALIGAAPAAETVTSVRWDFGDGTPAVIITDPTKFTVPQYKAYKSVGTYTVTLGFTASSGRVGSATRSVTVAPSAASGQLNDTGIDWCARYTASSSTWVHNIICSTVDWAGDLSSHLFGEMQDGLHGRDKQAREGRLTKKGSGEAGFDYTRLAIDGQPLSIQDGQWSDAGNNANGTRWDCVRDNVTGLVWEIKTRHDATALRHYTATFSWYNTDNSRNGGSPGSDVSGNAAYCRGVADAGKCNTQAYAAAVNALPVGQALCGYRDWRMPSKDELVSLSHMGRVSPAIAVDHFPDISSAHHMKMWSSSPLSFDSRLAWFVNFSDGSTGYNEVKQSGLHVRLVRSGN
jgi:PKD repeat protein